MGELTGRILLVRGGTAPPERPTSDSLSPADPTICHCGFGLKTLLAGVRDSRTWPCSRLLSNSAGGCGVKSSTDPLLPPYPFCPPVAVSQARKRRKKGSDPNGTKLGQVSRPIRRLQSRSHTRRRWRQRCFCGWPCCRTSACASRRGLVRSGITLRAAFQCARLDPAAPQPDPGFGDQHQQGMDAHRIVGCAAAALPGNPDLHGVLEAQLARDLVRQQGGLGHQEADQIVGQQVDPQLLEAPSPGSCNADAPCRAWS